MGRGASDGYVVGATLVSSKPRHNGEMHPDADELLFLVAGGVDVLFKVDGGVQTLELSAGDACVVPKGVWHRIFAAMADDPDFEYLILDSTIVRAHQHAAGAKRGLRIRPPIRLSDVRVAA